MGQFGIGQPVRRKEDVRLLMGAGLYTDDVNFDGQCWGVFVRSPQAHANILSIDIEAASAAEGVVGVYTGKDLKADGVGILITDVEMKDLTGKAMFRPKRDFLAIDRVRFVGEPVAFVIAETQAQAKAAAELVMVDYEGLPAVGSTAFAASPDSPVIWEELGSNVGVHWENRPEAEIDVHMAKAKYRAIVDLVNNRIVPNPMEPRCAIAKWDAAAASATRRCANAGRPPHPGRHRQDGAQRAGRQGAGDFADVGGGFGIRGKLYPDLGVIAYATRKSGRPIKWRGDRSKPSCPIIMAATRSTTQNSASMKTAASSR